MAGWANVETILAEVAIRASKHPAYDGIRDRYPYKLTNKLAYLRRLLDSDGPLARYRELGLAVIERFESGADSRNMMAHARMGTITEWGADFTFFSLSKERYILHRQEHLSEAQLKSLALRSASFSRLMERLLSRIDGLRLLPLLGDTSA